MIKFYTTFLGGLVMEMDNKYYLCNVYTREIEQKITKKDMMEFLQKYRHINIINRPALCFIYEKLLGKKAKVIVDTYTFNTIEEAGFTFKYNRMAG
jgi:hypothetical protein